MGLYNTVTETLPSERTDFWKLWQWVLNRQCQLPSDISFRCQRLLKKPMSLEPRERRSLTEVTCDLWLNEGQEEGLRLHSELSCEDMDP